MSDSPAPEGRKTKGFELLASVAAFAREKGIALNDPSLVTQFIGDAEPRLKAALSYQFRYVLTFAQGSEQMERMRPVSVSSAFQALQQASMTSSRSAKTRLDSHTSFR